MGCVTSQRQWLHSNQRLLVLTTSVSKYPARTDLTRWCWIAEKRHCHQRLNRMCTIIVAPLCSIYISNILQALKCQLTGWLQICYALHQVLHHLLSSRRSGHPDLVLTWLYQVKSTGKKALMNDWSSNLEEEG